MNRNLPLTIASIAFGTAALFSCVSNALQAQTDSRAKFQEAIVTNSLIEAAKAPFHLKVSFQYHNMDGKLVESGILEEWWVSPDLYLVNVSAPSVNQGRVSTLDDVSEKDLRESYLLQQLLDAEVNPIHGFGKDPTRQITEKQQNASRVPLLCYFAADNPTHRYCVDPQSKNLCLEEIGFNGSIIRNAPGLFHKTNV